MGANVNLNVLGRPKLSALAFGLGLFLSILAWQRGNTGCVRSGGQTQLSGLHGPGIPRPTG